MTEESETTPFQTTEGGGPDGKEPEARWPVQWTNRLQRLATNLSGGVDTASMAREAVDHARSALGASAGVVFLLSPDGESLEIAHAAGYGQEVVRRWARFPLASLVPATDAVRNREAVLVRSPDEMRQLYPQLANTPGASLQPSCAAVPLVVDGTCIGALGLSFAVAQVFETQEVAFLRVVADQCAQALQRAQLAERERRSAARLRALAQASRVFAATNPDVRSVLDAVATEVLTHVGEACAVSLASPDGEWLDAAAVHDRDPERQQILRAMGATLRLRRGEGLSGEVLATGRTVLLRSIAPNELPRRTAAAIQADVEALHTRSLLVVPLKTSGRTVGTLTSSRFDDSEPFTDDDQTLLEDLADRAALAIENARLHEVERQARARAEDADRRKDEFLAMLSHELRNPLAPIWTAIEILRQLPAPGERQLWAREAIARQVTQLSRLVDDLLDISRINLGKIELRLEPLDLGTVALQALEASRPLLSERSHHVSVELPSVPARVQGDAIRLTQVISNLLNNAAKYTDPAGHVRLSVASEGGEAVVTVSDNGIGIRADMLDHVFDLFAQGPEARDRSKGGLGIGLTLVKRLVEMHGGNVRASSAGEGRGSEFVLGLPLLDAATGLVTTGAPSAERPPAARRVLIADDNTDAAEGLRQLLELQSHEVEVVHDGAAAFEALARSEPEVVLLDIGLPGMDGLEVARRVRARGGAHRPLLVAVTGLGRDEDRQRSADAGFDHHLVKPIDLASLEALLAGAAGVTKTGL
jgi:signal transduction histidine kinase/ActR/RegA family two-component response regulator